MEFILASSSPRRQNFLKELGYSFTIFSPDVDETPIKGERPKDYVMRVARDKAQAVAAKNAGKVVLAADTCGDLGGKVLGKPEDRADAFKMLMKMQGRRHKIYTAVCVIDADGNLHEKRITSMVKMVPITQKVLNRFLDDESNWQGKAGAYGLQTAAGGALVQWVQGSYTGIIGLPLAETGHLLRRAGCDL